MLSASTGSDVKFDNSRDIDAVNLYEVRPINKAAEIASTEYSCFRIHQSSSILGVSFCVQLECTEF